MKFLAEIRHNASGVIKPHTYEVEDKYADNQDFWWHHGNASCDCNRDLFFHQTDDPDYSNDDSFPCSNGIYSVRITKLTTPPEIIYNELNK